MASGRERGAAPTSRCRIRIPNDKLRTFETFRIINLSSHQVLVAHWVDEQGHPIFFHGGIVFIDFFIKGKTILEAGTTATGNEYAQLEAGITLFLDQLFNLVGRTVGKQQRTGDIGNSVHLTYS